MSGPHGIKNARRWPESGKLSNESSSGVLTASKFDLAAGQNPKIHTQFTCIVLAVLALFPDFIGGFSHLRIFFMATSSFILNAMQKSRADNERKWIMFEAQHLTSPCKFLDLPPLPLSVDSAFLNHRWGGAILCHCAALCECISRCTVTVYCCHAEADK